MPNLDQLQAFVTAAEQGSFSAAARKLGKAQSAVSTAVINLEIDSGIELFDRRGRSPQLTATGETLLKYARFILRSHQEFDARATSIGEGLELKLGIAVEQGTYVHALMDLFSELGNSFPQLQVEMFDSGPNEVADLLKQGRADIGIMTEQETYPQGFFFRGIGHSQQMPVCSPQHPLAEIGVVSHADLRSHRQFITKSASDDSDNQFREQKSPDIWIGESPYLVVDLVLSGLGWAELPWTVVSDKLDNGSLVRLDYDFQQSRILLGVDLVWTEQRALGNAGRWLMERLLQLPATIWSE